MAIHGTERQLENRLTNLRADQMANGQKLYELEQQLNRVLARLDAVERELAERGVSLGD